MTKPEALHIHTPHILTSGLSSLSNRITNRTPDPPRSSAQAADAIRSISGQSIGLTWTWKIMRRCGLRFIKMQPIPEKASAGKQKEWVAEIQPIINRAKEGVRRIYFMDAVHFTPEAFTCHVWCKKLLYLKTGAGRNRFNLLRRVDPFTLDLIESHSMLHVDAGQVKAFLEKVREKAGMLPASIVLDNARNQHYKAVMEKASEL